MAHFIHYLQNNNAMVELQVLMTDINGWADKQFGEDRPLRGVANHLKQEAGELSRAFDNKNNLSDLLKSARMQSGNEAAINHLSEKLSLAEQNVNEELADCFILVLNAAAKKGLTAYELIHIANQKMKINKTRKWGKLDQEGVSNHIDQ